MYVFALNMLLEDLVMFHTNQTKRVFCGFYHGRSCSNTKRILDARGTTKS